MAEEQEPTRGELARTMSRFEAMIVELKSDLKQFAQEWRAQAASAALLTLRVETLETWRAEITREFERQDGRLDAAERDLFARQDEYQRSSERSRRATAWVAIGLSAVAVVVTVAGLALKGGR